MFSNLVVIFLFMFLCNFILKFNYFVEAEGSYKLDLTKVVNPHNFSYILQPGDLACASFNSSNNNATFLLFYIHTNPSRLRNRILIRETWGNKLMFPNIQVIFMMGKSSNERMNKLIAQENQYYGDIVQENFIDSYRNLTYKAIMAMKWISTHCKGAHYIVKVDDDIFVDTFKLTNHLAQYHKHKIAKNRAIMCHKWSKSVVNRDKKSKWYVSKDEMKESTYKTYCAGAAYVLSPDLPELMYNISFHVPFFWIDDYYVTGLLAFNTKSDFKEWASLFSMHDFTDNIRGFSSEYRIFAHFPKKFDNMVKLWNILYRKYKNTKILKYKQTILVFKWNADIWQHYL